MNPWLFNEFSHPGVDHSDPDYPAHYDATMRRFRDFDKEAAETVSLLCIGKDDTVVEIGCGTGAFALPGARACRRLVAVDTSLPMLDFTTARARAAGIANLECVHAGFLTYRHSGGAADAAVTKMALHHLPDFWKMAALRNVHSFLKPGGRFLLNDVIFSLPVAECAAAFQAEAEGLRQLAGEKLAAEAEVHFREEFSTFDWILDAMLERTGFMVVSKTAHSPTRMTYLCRK